MKEIEVFIKKKKVGELFYEEKDRRYIFNYTKLDSCISLIMPCKNSSYIWKDKLHPIFDMNMPEGYLFEIFKNYLEKEFTYINDFLLFTFLSPNIDNRLNFKSSFSKNEFEAIDLDDILNNDTKDTFSKLVKTFLSKNSISGIQPKTLALVKDKESLETKEYIIKTWGDEYPNLAQNEYFCLKALELAGIVTANVLLSNNQKFLLVEKFNYNKEKDEYLGFEEILTLMGKNKDQKYNGSYEQIAKVIYSLVSNKEISMRMFFKTIVMNYLLKNGDAHLKNFGILYNDELTNIEYSPAYDVVNTCIYFFKDRPALSMFGKRLWFGKKELIKFACESCFINKNDAERYYEQCFTSLLISIEKLEIYLKENQEFENIGNRILDTWKISLNKKTIKEIPYEITRAWK